MATSLPDRVTTRLVQTASLSSCARLGRACAERVAPPQSSPPRHHARSGHRRLLLVVEVAEDALELAEALDVDGVEVDLVAAAGGAGQSVCQDLRLARMKSLHGLGQTSRWRSGWRQRAIDMNLERATAARCQLPSVDRVALCCQASRLARCLKQSRSMARPSPKDQSPGGEGNGEFA